ncbi:MAG: energy transducer TonB [Gemmatimonadaceae bacterium]
MFNRLIESKRDTKKSPGTTIFSIVFHSVIIGGAAWATANAAIANEKVKAEKIQFVEVKKDEPPPPKKPDIPPPPPKNVTVTPPPPKGFQVLTAPPIVPIKIPDIDLSKKVTDAADFSGKGVAGGTSKGVVGGVGPVSDKQDYFAFQVEKQASAMNDVKPEYPSSLQSAGIEGEVDVQFVVGIDGRADMSTFKVTKSSNDMFSNAVRTAVSRARYSPAEIGGKKVRMLVQQPFMFGIAH